MTKAEITKLYNRTKRGLSRRFYNHQVERCKTRGHDLPSYNRDEFENWLYSQNNFEKLYNDWVNSDYSKDIKPSVDRLNDYKSYTFDNIQLTTWKENNNKAKRDTKNGILTKATMAVKQFTKNDELVGIYVSIAIASRETGSSSKAISECLSGRTKTSNGFIWRYA